MEKISKKFEKWFQPPYLDAWSASHVMLPGLAAFILDRFLPGIYVIFIVHSGAWIWELYEMFVQDTKTSYWDNERWRMINTYWDVYLGTFMAIIVVLAGYL